MADCCGAECSLAWKRECEGEVTLIGSSGWDEENGDDWVHGCEKHAKELEGWC